MNSVGDVRFRNVAFSNERCSRRVFVARWSMAMAEARWRWCRLLGVGDDRIHAEAKGLSKR